MVFLVESSLNNPRALPSAPHLVYISIKAVPIMMHFLTKKPSFLTSECMTYSPVTKLKALCPCASFRYPSLGAVYGSCPFVGFTTIPLLGSYMIPSFFVFVTSILSGSFGFAKLFLRGCLSFLHSYMALQLLHIVMRMPHLASSNTTTISPCPLCLFSNDPLPF